MMPIEQCVEVHLVELPEQSSEFTRGSSQHSNIFISSIFLHGLVFLLLGYFWGSIYVDAYQNTQPFNII